MKKIYKHGLAILVPICLLLFAYIRMGFYYSTNDDRCLTEILAGIVTLKPDAHLVYVNYLLSLPLSLLYKITTVIPWFGWMLVLFYYLSYVFILESAYSRTKNILEDFIFTGIIAFFFLSNFYFVGQMTYTAIAIFMAAAGYVAITLHNNKKIGLLFFIILETLSFLLRDNAMLMIQPLGMSVLLTTIFCKDFSNFKKNIKTCIQIICVALSIVLIGFLGNKLGYLGPEWSSYKQFNDVRTTLFDYTEMPPYEEVKDILDKYEVSQATYEGFSGYTILFEDINTDCLLEIAEYAQKTTTTGMSFSEAIKENYKILTKEDTLHYYQINKVLIVTFVSVLLYIVISWNLQALISFFALFLCKSAVWIYLIMAGRYPQRITLPLLACETLFLILLAFLTYLSKNRYSSKKSITLLRFGILFISMLIFCRVSYTNGQLQNREIKHVNDGQKIFIEGLIDITEYCNLFPENRYIVETASLRWYSGSVFENKIFSPRNYIIGGGWFSNMPCVLEKNQSYLKDTSNGFYLIIHSDGKEMEHSSVIYLSELSNSTPILADTFTATHGGTYSVIYFDGQIIYNIFVPNK